MADLNFDKAEELGGNAAQFIKGLANESERATVILGVARLDVGLEYLLKAFMNPYPGGEDNLFDSDRPLGSFSAKIGLASRLGLIEPKFERALQIVRKLRNDFAHSIEKEILSVAPHKDRVYELVMLVQADSLWSGVGESLGVQTVKEPFVNFCISISVMIIRLEVAVPENKSITSQPLAMFSSDNL